MLEMMVQLAFYCFVISIILSPIVLALSFTYLISAAIVEIFSVLKSFFKGGK